MAGLVPAIPAGTCIASSKSIAPSGAEKRVEVLISTCRLTAWIPGTRPGMTRMASGQCLILAHMGTSPGMTKTAYSGIHPAVAAEDLPKAGTFADSSSIVSSVGSTMI